MDIISGKMIVTTLK